ncbi:glycosyltransferase family 2 protein [Flectobacillus sp. BAB-3569]|uniref:glycosyltransferase family 2 protein n=1 Tax=Flectobacillus sp. BAB-3569 TaxID=1509483 RepID=UPI000BA2DAD6|nr:glycosyltransferase family 2 protein [Flectobacillus sp. BAB-3569]PAC33416.1 glycosyl transferase [Flectobacillus sp. BAB-3569]
MNRTTKLDVVHPCYNPHEGWEKELLHYYKIFVSQLPSQVEVKLYLVDDGSIRGVTGAHLQYLQENIPSFEYVTYSQNRGKGFALRTAIAKTQGDLIIYTDADYPYRMENAWEMFRLLNDENYDVVLGVRDDHYYSQLPFLRKVFSLSLRTMNHVFFPSMFVKDTQSGLKGFNQKGKEVFLKTHINSFLFDMEFVVLASRRKDLRLAKIQVHVRDGISFSQMSWKTIKQELLSFQNIFSRSK